MGKIAVQQGDYQKMVLFQISLAHIYLSLKEICFPNKKEMKRCH